MIEICTVGGYSEIGKNMTAVKVDDEVVIFDMGLHLEKYIRYTETDDVVAMDEKRLLRAGAIPDVSAIRAWRNKVRLIVPTHAHLDHVGAIPYLAGRFDAPVMCTPYTVEVLNAILRDEKIRIKNQIKPLNENSRYRISKNLELEFIRVTHSTPQTVFAALHTRYGTILYANDFKFDPYPVLGKRPDFERLRKLGESKKGVIALICDSTNADIAIKTPSESVAREMLRNVMLGTECKGRAIVVTTFSSHLARIKSILFFAKQLGRKVIFLGRSLRKYINAGEKINLVDFSEEAEVVGFSYKIERKLRKVQKAGKEKFVLVVTGHQGEPKSVLSKIIGGRYPFRLTKGDHVIFSSTVIPTKTNELARQRLDEKLTGMGLRVFKDIHVSGHAGREDLRDLLILTKPKNVIPAHGTLAKKGALADLAMQMGYRKKKNLFLTRNGEKVVIR